MLIIEIQALSNGAHRNQTGEFKKPPEGWASVPEEMAIPDTFPFVHIEVLGNTVVELMPGTIQKQEEPETIPTAQDDLDAMLVDHEYRLTLLELGINEGEVTE